MIDKEARAFLNKPSLGIISFFIPGIILAENYISAKLYCALVTSALLLFSVAVLVVVYCYYKKRRIYFWSFGVVAYLSFTLGYIVSYSEQHSLRITVQQKSSPIEAIVTNDIVQTPKATRIPVTIQKGNSDIVGAKLLLYDYRKKINNLQLGDTIQCKIRKIEEQKKTRSTSYRHWLRCKNVVATATISWDNTPLIIKQQKGVTTMYQYAQQFRNKLLKRIDMMPIGNDVKAYLKAVSLGYKSDEALQIQQSFRVVGAAHILSVSGFHLIIVCGFISLLFSWIDFFPQIRFIKPCTTLLVAWGFAFITGLAAPTIRAALMLSLYQLAKLLNIPSDPKNLLFFTAFTLLLFHPGYIFDIGFQLSFTAVLSILVFLPFFKLQKLSNRNPLLFLVYRGFALCISAQILTIPLILYHFGLIPITFVWSNLPLVFIATLVIPITLVTVLLNPLIHSIPWLYSFIVLVLNKLSEITLRVLTIFTPSPKLVISAKLNGTQLIGCYLLIVALYIALLRLYQHAGMEEKKNTSANYRKKTTKKNPSCDKTERKIY